MVPHRRHRAVRARTPATAASTCSCRPATRAPSPRGTSRCRRRPSTSTSPLRAIPSAGARSADAVAYAKRVRAYPLAQAGRSPANRYIDAYPEDLADAAGLRHELLRALAQIDRRGAAPGEGRGDDRPAGQHRHPQGHALPARGPARPRPRAGGQGRAAGRWSTTSRRRGSRMAPYRPDGHWMVGNTTPHDGATFLVDGKLLIDERAGGYSYWSRFAPKRPAPGVLLPARPPRQLGDSSSRGPASIACGCRRTCRRATSGR